MCAPNHPEPHCSTYWLHAKGPCHAIPHNPTQPQPRQPTPSDSALTYKLPAAAGSVVSGHLLTSCLARRAAAILLTFADTVLGEQQLLLLRVLVVLRRPSCVRLRVAAPEPTGRDGCCCRGFVAGAATTPTAA